MIPLISFHFLSNTVRAMLEGLYDDAMHDFHAEGWSLQGFGMLRLYLTDDRALRLHVWDSRYRADPAPSVIHTHPWDLESVIVSGSLTNIRYVETDFGLPFKRQTILCGPGGGICARPRAGAVVVVARLDARALELEFRCDSPPIRVTVTVPFFETPNGHTEAAAFARACLSPTYDWQRSGITAGTEKAIQ